VINFSYTEGERRTVVAICRKTAVCVCVFYPAPSEGWEPSISK